jgi:hypothetical protein
MRAERPGALWVGPPPSITESTSDLLRSDM